MDDVIKVGHFLNEVLKSPILRFQVDSESERTGACNHSLVDILEREGVDIGKPIRAILEGCTVSVSYNREEVRVNNSILSRSDCF